MTKIEQVQEHVNELTDSAGLVKEYAERILLLNKYLTRDVEEAGVLDIPYPAIDLCIAMMVEDAMSLESVVEKDLADALKAYKEALYGAEEGGEDAC